MQAQPQIQGIHESVELSDASLETEASTQTSDIERDESDLVEAQEHQTETISGSQVACAFNRMAEEHAQVKKESQLRVVTVTIAAVMVVVGLYAGLVLM